MEMYQPFENHCNCTISIDIISDTYVGASNQFDLILLM